MSHELETVTTDLKLFFTPLGLEVHPFLVGYYNDAVSENFKLNYEADTVAFVLISTPTMFEEAFIPFLKFKLDEATPETKATPRDPLDACMRHYFQEAVSNFSDHKFEIIQDFELLPNKRPKILVQTAAHVAGAAFYYQRKDAEEIHSESCFFREISNLKKTNNLTEEDNSINKQCDKTKVQENIVGKTEEKLSGRCTCLEPWDRKKRIYGVSIHPRYGGWFAIRGVLIASNLRGDLPRKEPIDCVVTRAARVELLNRFNGNWQDWTFRDIIPVSGRYSDLQKKYFATSPEDRNSLIVEILNSSLL